jgi:hypothetical protein
MGLSENWVSRFFLGGHCSGWAEWWLSEPETVIAHCGAFSYMFP